MVRGWLPPSLADWQDACLRLPSLCAGQSLLYSLPTSGGKTLVAEVLVLQQVLLKRRDVLLIVPFVSIAQEKVRRRREAGLVHRWEAGLCRT